MVATVGDRASDRRGARRSSGGTSLGYERAQAQMDLEKALERLLTALDHLRTGQYAWAADEMGVASNAVGSSRYHLRQVLERSSDGKAQ